MPAGKAQPQRPNYPCPCFGTTLGLIAFRRHVFVHESDLDLGTHSKLLPLTRGDAEDAVDLVERLQLAAHPRNLIYTIGREQSSRYSCVRDFSGSKRG